MLVWKSCLFPPQRSEADLKPGKDFFCTRWQQWRCFSNLIRSFNYNTVHWLLSARQCRHDRCHSVCVYAWLCAHLCVFACANLCNGALKGTLWLLTLFSFVRVSRNIAGTAVANIQARRTLQKGFACNHLPDHMTNPEEGLNPQRSKVIFHDA